MFYGAAIVNHASAEFRHKICKAEQTPNYESFREQAGGQEQTPKFFACSRPDVGVEHCIAFS